MCAGTKEYGRSRISGFGSETTAFRVSGDGLGGDTLLTVTTVATPNHVILAVGHLESGNDADADQILRVVTEDTEIRYR